MEFVREVTEDTVILEFLRGEYGSARFGEDVRAAMLDLHCPDAWVTCGDPERAEENALRRRVLGCCRGWGEDREMFENFPREVAWRLVRTGPDDLERLRYIRYDYWDELSRMTGRPSAAARTVREGREIFGVSNQPFLDGADALRRGVRFPPLIVMERDADHYILLEGHSRATVYALEPDFFPGTCCFVGRAEDAAALAAWAGAPLDGK